MTLNTLLAEKNITMYRLSKLSGIPSATISDIFSGKAKIEKCSGETLYKLAKTLNVSMESLLESSFANEENRISFENFKSNVCHRVKELGDLDFIAETLKSDDIRRYYDKKWYAESFYLLAMVDYLSRENDIPIYAKYNDLRQQKLSEKLYPASIIALSVAANDNTVQKASEKKAIPEFLRFNIIEGNVRDVV